MPKTVECPNCHQFNAVPLAGIGQYVTCDFCGCKYYVYVPPLEESSSSNVEQPHARSAASQRTEPARKADEPHPLEEGVMIRQESLLATIHEDLVELRRRITIACFLFVAGCSAVIAIILTR